METSSSTWEIICIMLQLFMYERLDKNMEDRILNELDQVHQLLTMKVLLSYAGISFYMFKIIPYSRRTEYLARSNLRGVRTLGFITSC